MISKILHNYLNNKSPFETVFAHCDIPCKIYDPVIAQISVLTMIRLVDLIDELDITNSGSITATIAAMGGHTMELPTNQPLRVMMFTSWITKMMDILN